MSESGPAPTGWIKQALQQAFRALTEGRPAEAGALCRRVLDAAPELAEAHFLVGMVALELQDHPTAIAAFGSVTRLRPAHGAAWAQLAWLFMRAGRAVDAGRAQAEAARHAGDNPAVADLIGTTWSLLGDQQAARDWYRRAVERNPDRIDYRVNLANAELFLGATDAAEAALRAVLAQAPEHAQAHWLLAGLRTATDRRQVDVLDALAGRPGQTDRQIAFLSYAAGKQYEDLGAWDAAFAAYARGARHRRRTVTFDEPAEVALFAALQRVYDAGWLARRPAGLGAGTTASDAAATDAGGGSPIFVIGQPRTGTTLVERIIAAHSMVHSAGELQQFGLAVRRLDGQGGPRRSDALVTRAAELDPAALGRAYLAGCERQRGTAPRFVDKLPGNFMHVPLILAALPDARIVHLVRDPMDACFASFKQLFADGYPHSYDQAEQARHFVRYHRLMAHWRAEFPGRLLDVRYEDLVADLAPRARALIAYLGLPWEDACLDFHRAGGAVVTASAAQVREPAHTRSVGRWRHFEQALQPMREILEAAGIATG